MKTLLLALISSEKSRSTREGAIRGLIGIGKEAVRKGMVEGGGAKVVGQECMPGEEGGLAESVMVSLVVRLDMWLISCRCVGRAESATCTECTAGPAG